MQVGAVALQQSQAADCFGSFGTLDCELASNTQAHKRQQHTSDVENTMWFGTGVCAPTTAAAGLALAAGRQAPHRTNNNPSTPITIPYMRGRLTRNIDPSGGLRPSLMSRHYLPIYMLGVWPSCVTVSAWAPACRSHSTTRFLSGAGGASLAWRRKTLLQAQCSGVRPSKS